MPDRHHQSHLGKFSGLTDIGPNSVRTLKEITKQPSAPVDSNERRKTLAAFLKYKEIFDLIYTRFHPDEPPINISVDIKSHLKISTVLVEIRIAYKAYCENAAGLRGMRWATPYDYHHLQAAWNNTKISLSHNGFVFTAKTLVKQVQMAPAVVATSEVEIVKANDPNADAIVISFNDHEAVRAICLLITKRKWPAKQLVQIVDANSLDEITRALVQFDVAIIPNDDGTFNLM